MLCRLWSELARSPACDVCTHACNDVGFTLLRLCVAVMEAMCDAVRM